PAELVERLLMLPGVGLGAYRDDGGAVLVARGRLRARVREDAAGVSYEPLVGDPLGLGPLPLTLPDRELLEASRATQFPDAPRQRRVGRGATRDRARGPAGTLPLGALALDRRPHRAVVPDSVCERTDFRAGARDARADADGGREGVSASAGGAGRRRGQPLHGLHQLSCVRSGDPPSPSGKGQELARRAERAGAVPAQSVLCRVSLLVESDPVLDRLDARSPVALLDAEILAG